MHRAFRRLRVEVAEVGPTSRWLTGFASPCRALKKRFVKPLRDGFDLSGFHLSQWAVGKKSVTLDDWEDLRRAFSYFLWGTIRADDSLLTAAEKGQLRKKGRINRAVATMLDDEQLPEL